MSCPLGASYCRGDDDGDQLLGSNVVTGPVGGPCQLEPMEWVIAQYGSTAPTTRGISEACHGWVWWWPHGYPTPTDTKLKPPCEVGPALLVQPHEVMWGRRLGGGGDEVVHECPTWWDYG